MVHEVRDVEKQVAADLGREIAEALGEGNREVTPPPSAPPIPAPEESTPPAEPTPTPPAPAPGPGSCVPPPDRQGDVLKGVYNPGRLQILADCSVAEGLVEEVSHEQDGDIHIRLKPDPEFMSLAKQGQDFIICEIVPADQAAVQEPQVGQHIHLEGPWCYDKNHDWQEIHPVWKLVIL